MSLKSDLESLNACLEAREWAGSYSDAKEAWLACPKGSWMLWVLGKTSREVGSDSRKKLVLTCCKCARLALPFTKDKIVLQTIETTEKYARGEASLEQVRAAAAAAYAAYTAAAAAAASAAYTAAAAAAASDAAAYAAYAAYAAARAKIELQCADLVRADYPDPPIL